MALEFLEAQRNVHPELADWYDAMADLYQRELWHQLTMKLEQFIDLPVVRTGDVLIQLYDNFIVDFETKINLLKLAQFVVIVSQQYSVRDDAISYLDWIIGKLLKNPEWVVDEPILYISMQMAGYYFEKGDVNKVKMILEDGKSMLEIMNDIMNDIDPLVQVSYYWVLSQYHKFQQEFTEFYKDTLLCLAYTSVETLSAPWKLSLAFDLSLSALLGDSIYNFGELLSHPIINSLIGTTSEWIYHILQAFNSGNLIHYQELRRIHNAAFSEQPALVVNERKLLEKINILCLMEIIFCRPSEDRTIPLSIIAERTKLSIEDVEFLLMKALSLHLIEGIIDQVEGTVCVSWVQPRVLGIPQVKSLCDRLDLWRAKVQTAFSTVETETREHGLP